MGFKVSFAGDCLFDLDCSQRVGLLMCCGPAQYRLVLAFPFGPQVWGPLKVALSPKHVLADAATGEWATGTAVPAAAADVWLPGIPAAAARGAHARCTFPPIVALLVWTRIFNCS